MGRFDERLPQNPEENSRGNSEPLEATAASIQAVAEELQIIKQNLLKSLQEDVNRLETDRNRLLGDIRRLQEEKENLQTSREVSELQPLVRQLAQVMANHITFELQSSVEKLISQAASVNSSGQADEGSVTTQINENTAQLLGSLDDTITITFNTLQQELNNYHSNLSQQLSRMLVQGQQGEAILAELVNRLRSELEKTTQTTATSQERFLQEFASTQQQQTPEEASTFSWNQNQETQASVSPATQIQNQQTQNQQSENQEIVVNNEPISRIPPTPSLPPSIPATEEPPSNSGISPSVSVGIILILFSAVTSSLYNVAIKVIFHQGGNIFGTLALQQLIPPTLGNCLLILMLRMLVVVPLMSLFAPMLHPRVWDDLERLVEAVRGNPTPERTKAKQLLGLSIASGCFLFLSQVLIYLAIGNVATGMAIALLFIYPIVTILLSWLLFRDRPSSFRIGAAACIGIGELLILAGATGVGVGNLSVGSTTAIFSGVAFASYVILTRICATRLHPVSSTLINFATMLLLCFVFLILPYPQNLSVQVYTPNILELILSAFVLGVLTICAYLLNNFGVRKLGATRSAIMGATVPAFTVIFAGLIIQEALQPEQILGILLITFGTAAFGWERMRKVRTST